MSAVAPLMRDEEAAERFVGWLEAEVLAAARGDRDSTSENDPSGKYFLGRLASEDAVANGGLGDRGERLEPCAIGLRLRPALSGAGPWHLRARVRCLAWLRVDERAWRKSLPVDMAVDCLVGPGRGTWRLPPSALAWSRALVPSQATGVGEVVLVPLAPARAASSLWGDRRYQTAEIA